MYTYEAIGRLVDWMARRYHSEYYSIYMQYEAFSRCLFLALYQPSHCLYKIAQSSWFQIDIFFLSLSLCDFDDIYIYMYITVYTLSFSFGDIFVFMHRYFYYQSCCFIHSNTFTQIINVANVDASSFVIVFSECVFSSFFFLFK